MARTIVLTHEDINALLKDRLVDCKHCGCSDCKIEEVPISAGEHLTDWFYEVVCSKCGAFGACKEYLNEAVSSWNRGEQQES